MPEPISSLRLRLASYFLAPSLTRRIYILAISALCSILFLAHSAGSFYYAVRSDPWSHGDWLIDYSHGYVRRGLTGSIAQWLWRGLDVEPQVTIVLIQVIAAALYFAHLSWILAKAAPSKAALILLLMPVGFLYVFVDPAVAGRKEILFFALATMCLCWTYDTLLVPKVLFIALWSALTFLSHEGLAMFVPLLAIVMSYKLQGHEVRQRLAILGAVVLPATIAILLAFSTSGKIKASVICADWSPEKYSNTVCSGAIKALDDSVQTSASQMFLSLLHNPMYTLGYGTIIAILSFVFILMAHILRLARNWRCLITLAIAASSPIFLVASDWGRWLNILAVVISVFYYLVISNQDRKSNFKSVEERGTSQIAFLIALFLYTSTWGVYQSGGNFSSIIRVLRDIPYYLSGGQS